ncbi:hypothetical protein Tco_1147397, partial [Tanacetum coccineum]
FVMSDSEDSTVHFTREAALQATPSPDYVLGLGPIARHHLHPYFVLEKPVNPEFYATRRRCASKLRASHSNNCPLLAITRQPIINPIHNPSVNRAVDRFLAIYTPLPSPLTSYSPPLLDSPTQPLGYRAAIIRLRAEDTTIRDTTIRTPPLLHIPLPTPSPHLLLPSTDCRAGVSEVMLSPRKRLCITLGSRFEVSESSSAPTTRPTKDFRRDYGFVATLDDEIRRDLERDVGYGITDTWDEMVEDIQGILEATDVAELSKRITNFVMTIRQDTDEIYRRLDDAQDDRSLMSGQLNLLRRDRRAHAHTTRLMESEARLSCEAWVQSMDASDTTRSEVRALRTTVLAQQTEVKDL